MREPIIVTSRSLFRHLQPMDIIKSDEGTWVSKTCPECFGSGLDQVGFVLVKCQRCNGHKVVWIKVTNVTTESERPYGIVSEEMEAR